MKISPLNSLLLLAIWPTTVVVQAFASSSSVKTTLLSPPKSFLQKHHQLQNHHNNQLHTTTTTSLNVFGGSAAKSAAAAVTNLIPRGGGGDIASKVSSLASTPNGSFNLALGVLAACTAVLKISNKANADKDDGAVVKKDPKVKALQTRFLMVFWLLRMADWLQVSIYIVIVCCNVYKYLLQCAFVADLIVRQQTCSYTRSNLFQNYKHNKHYRIQTKYTITTNTTQ